MFADMVEHYLVEPTPRNDAARAVARGRTNLYNLLYSEPIFMSAKAIDRVHDICIPFGSNWTFFREWARCNNELSFAIKPNGRIWCANYVRAGAKEV